MRSARTSTSSGTGRRRWRGAGLVAALGCIGALQPQRGVAEAQDSAPPPTVIVPFAVDEAAARWARAAVPAHGAPLDRLRRLSRALLDSAGRPIVEAAHTSTAPEVFVERRANCVGYANLFVGLA